MDIELISTYFSNTELIISKPFVNSSWLMVKGGSSLSTFLPALIAKRFCTFNS